MDTLLAPLQAIPAFEFPGLPGLLSTLVVVVVVLLVARFLLKVAVKVAVLAAVVLGVLWLFGALPVLPI